MAKFVILKIKNKECVLIDTQDLPLVSKYKWYCVKRKSNKKSYIQNSKGILLHRLILNAPKNKQVDHINGNSLDNRKQNLRLCTNQENARNRTKQRNNKSGFKGVSFDKDRNKWVARIKIHGIYKFLGRFETKELAYNKYTQIGKIHHKMFFRG